MRSHSVAKAVLAGSVGLLGFVSGCTTKPADTHAEEQTIRDLDAQWSKAAGAHDVEATIAYYSDDARVLPPDATLVTGKDAIRKTWAAILQPSDNLSWQVSTVDVAASGDLAYVTGTYEYDSKDASDRPTKEIGKMVEVFKKQADGKWKVCADIWNSDAPTPPVKLS